MDIGRQREHELEMQGCWICSEDQRLQSEEGICQGSDGFSFVAEPTTGNVVKPMEMSFNANGMHWSFTQLLALANQSRLGLNYVPGPEVEFPAAQRHCYDLNVLPGTTNNATYEGVPDFAPVTPEKPARTENKQQLSEMQHLHEEDRRDEKNEKQKNGGVLTTVNITEINNDKELPVAASDSLLSDAAVSTLPPKEKHLSGKEDDGYQIDLNKTPQQKQKRKKHRPKVVKEGKPKTPKPVAPKPANGSTGKRKYVRKNGLNKASKTPPPEVVGQCSESKTLEATRKSCRRVLNFGEEQPEDKHSTNRSPSSDSDSYSHIFCSNGVISKSTVQLCNAIQERVGNAQAGTACELGCSSHQLRGSCMSNPITFDSPHADIRSPNSSNCSTAINLGEGKGAKRKYCHAVKQAESTSSNLIGSYHNSVQAYQAHHTSYLDLPNIGHFPKRKRTEKTDPCDKNKVSVAGGKEIQNFPCVMALGQDARSTKKRSRVRARVRAKKGDEHRDEYCRKHQTCIDALVTDIGATLTKRKRTKKKSSLQLTGTPLEEVTIDAIIDQLKSLDINKEQNALVLYTSVDTIVPYEATKRKLRAKVALDEETTRVWKLLLDNINSEGVDGLDEEKIKWWEEERTVFQGRADSFIARMHLVQGDRGFSPWKGSVVDSVVGVFLTQNVSDHLSSSAFMALAAHFPLDSSNNDKALVCINEIPNGPVKKWSSMTLFSGSNGPVKSTYETECEMVYSSETGQEMYYNQLVNVSDISGTVTDCHTEKDGKTSDEDSFQNYVDSSISQFGDKGCSCSGTNSEIEDLPNKSKHDSLDNSTLFVELLQKAESCELHEVFVHGEYKYNRSKGPEHDNQKQTMDNDGPRTSKGVSSMDNAGASPVECFEIFREETQSSTFSQNKDENSMSGQSTITVENAATSKSKRKRVQKDKKQEVNWDKLREQAEINGKREKTSSTMDSLDWDAVRCADVNEIAETIKERGMNHMLAERIKDFLNRLVREHGSIDLEWLRDVPPDKAKEYLLSIRGLGLKSVECVRLLTLHHLAFPVDTNVGRIAVRLGWVPLQPLPESLQLHLLEMYPVLESIQKYLWPRLCKLDQRTLYELHYQMITFGKVFCTKNKPNCNACPMRGECRHFASAFASARLSLPWPEEKRVVTATGTGRDVNPNLVNNGTHCALLQAANHLEQNQVLDANHQPVAITTSRNCDPIIEEPASPEPESTQIPEDIEDAFSEDPDGIPTIKLNVEQFTQNLHTHMQESLHLQEGDVSKALVAIATGAASIPVPMLKNVRRLRTEHLVYELPDSHALLNMLNMETREPDDPCLYLLAIWTPGETANSIQLPQNRCNSEGCVELCNDNECLSCNTVREESSQTVRGTLLIPCRTAMRGSFPLNGTYFQVNEVFADHETSHNPINVPRSWLWKLKRRTVYFGTSVPSIFKGLSTHEIQQCFWRGHVCVRGFDKRIRAPRPLAARLHCPATKVDKRNINEG